MEPVVRDPITRVSYTQAVPDAGDLVYVNVIVYGYAADALGSALVRIPAT